MEVNLMKL